ncbi:DoxX family protein [Lacibacter sp. MH-610]|uniref:DoxX family protein n=1 Tax=Lacibacter sp. MH-610 TaxID=3020883 RepID=UPI001BB9326F|nr:DoxX family protein [Chitinophagaceae bacterium]
MLQKLFKTNNDYTGLLLRFAIGIVLFPHGAQKLLGWYGGYGFTGTMQFFTETVGLPWIIGLLVIVIEFFGSLLVLMGLGSRLAAVMIAFLSVGIIFTSHIQYGFFINWSGNQKGEGYEYFLLLIGLCLALLVNGSGKLSLDKVLAK